MSAASFTTDIPQRLDRLPWSRFHNLVVIALGVTWILDGLEVTIIGAIGPMLGHAETLALTPEQIGLTATAYLLGTVAGAIVFSYLTDRQGRKKWFLVTLYVYLVATLLTALAWDLWSFLLFRFIAGAGIGGEYAAINSAIDELIPSRSRGFADIAINGSWWLGTLIGAVVSIPLLNTAYFAADVGWRVSFGLGAFLGLAIRFVRRWVPESPRWLVIHGRRQEAEALLETIESRVKMEHGLEQLEEPKGAITIYPHRQANLLTAANQLIFAYPKRTVLGLSLMITQACLYNAIFFSYAMMLTVYYGVPAGSVGFYIVPFAISNFCGPLLLGKFFDTIGRRRMITLCYSISGLLLLFTGDLFMSGLLTAATQTVAWCAVFFFASAGASSAYLTVSEIFPVEIRAMAIAFFFIIAQGAASITPWIFGLLIQGSRSDLALGYLAASVLMILGAIAAHTLGINAEGRSLEEIAAPLSSSAD